MNFNFVNINCSVIVHLSRPEFEKTFNIRSRYKTATLKQLLSFLSEIIWQFGKHALFTRTNNGTPNYCTAVYGRKQRSTVSKLCGNVSGSKSIELRQETDEKQIIDL